MLPLPLSQVQAHWVRRLEATFDELSRTRMAGLPVCHGGLRVQAVGCRPWQVEAPAGTTGPTSPTGLLGVLITPWFMNLVWRLDEGQQGAGDWLHLPVGTAGRLQMGSQSLSFMGHHDPELGHYTACSLISPMFQFADHAAAVATAEAVMDTVSSEHAARVAPAAEAEAPAQPARRGFLLGRRHTAGDAA